MKLGLKSPIAWNDSTMVHSWQFYLWCRMEETGSPAIICIICHHVLRHPSEHGTSSMATHLLGKAHIAKWNEYTESEVITWTTSMVDETAWAIRMRQGSRGSPIVSLEMKFIFDIQVWSILTELIDKTLQTGSNGLSHAQISPRLL